MYDVHVAHVPTQKLKDALVKVKDTLPKKRFPGVLYELPGANCDRLYIGKSGNYERRLKEHCNDVKKETVSTNALAEHAQSSNHEIDWGKARVVATEKDFACRLYLESIMIQTNKNTLNRTDGNLPPLTQGV